MAIPSINDARNIDQLTTTINMLVRQFDNTGSVTLTNGTTSTVVVNAKVDLLSKVFLEPRTSGAAAVRNTTWISSIGTKTFTITHANAATVRTFDYVIHGA